MIIFPILLAVVTPLATYMAEIIGPKLSDKLYERRQQQALWRDARSGDAGSGMSFRVIPPIKKQNVELLMMVVISISVLFAALYIILSKNYDASAEKWAYSAISMLLGYWIKTVRR